MKDKRANSLKHTYDAHVSLLDAFHGNQELLNDRLLEFCTLFSEFVTTINPNLSPKRFDYIFNHRRNYSDKNVLNAHLFTAKEYAASIIERLTKNIFINLQSEALGVIFDYAKILKAVEGVYGLTFGEFYGERNMYNDAYTTYKLTNQIYWGEDELQRSNMLSGYSIFGIRQTIELAGKELLGLTCLLDTNNEIYRYGTQFPWKFLKANKDSEYINFPFKITDITTIYGWSNSFVHTGFNAPCYTIALALRTVKELFQRKQYANIFTEDSLEYSNEILDYNWLKTSFETFLKREHCVRLKPKWGVVTLATVLG